MSEQDLESTLGAAFSDEPVERPEPVQAETDVPEAQEVETDAPEADAEPVEAEAEPTPLLAEPEYEVEVDGAREVIKGADKVKELLQKGLKFGRGSEEIARVREALTAQYQAQQYAAQFQQAVVGDIAELRALDSQLEQYNKIDWNAAFDTDAFNALKLKEQRDQLREKRSAKLQELNQKQQQYTASQAQAASRTLAAEAQALLAKLPEWRNSEKATSEQSAIRHYLTGQGYSAAEIDSLSDHRNVLIARKAYLYDQLQAGKSQKLKQARTAPPVAKPGVNVPASEKAAAATRDAIKAFKEAGRKGNHRAQEASLAKMLERTFK